MINKDKIIYSFSVIIPVYKENERITPIIDHIKKISKDFDTQILVVDGDEEQKTIKTINDDKIIKLTSQKGRALQMNKGVDHSTGEFLLFLHADTYLPDKAFDLINNVFQSDMYVAGAFDMGIDNQKLVFKLTGYLASIKHRFTRVPYGDQVFFIKSEYFKKIGKFREIPLFEDVELMRRIKKNKDKIYIIPEKVITSARKWEKEGVWYTIFRNWTLEFLYLLGVSPEKLVKYYYKKK